MKKRKTQNDVKEKSKKDNIGIKAFKSPVFERYLFEAIGMAIIMFFGCGAICVLSGDYVLAYSLAFALPLIVCCYCFSKKAACHFNPAVSLAMVVQKKIVAKDFWFLCLSQVVGAIVGVLFLCIFNLIIPSSFDASIKLFGSTGFSTLSKCNITLGGCAIVEFIITLVLVLAYLGSKSDKKLQIIAPILYGLTLVFVYMFAFPLTGASANPARSIGPAFMMMFYGNFLPIIQVGVVVLVTLAGGALAGYLWNFLKQEKQGSKSR